MKITICGAICPVAGGVILAGMMLVSACKSAGEETEVQTSVEHEPLMADAVEVTGFTYEASPPDTITLNYSGEGSAVVTDIFAAAGQKINEGDTLLEFRDDLYIVERERLTMELDFASVMLSSMPEDTLLQGKVDSLALFLDSLMVDENTPYLSPLEGSLEKVLPAVDDRIRPGNALAEISVASSELFYVFPPGECKIDSWPSAVDGIRFVEEHREYAVYSGDLSAIEIVFSRLMEVPREAVYESELESYLVTSESDTITVLRVGEKDNGNVIVLPSVPVEKDILTWAVK